MQRLPARTPAELTSAQRELYDLIAGGPRTAALVSVIDAEGALTGPFNAMLECPELGTALQEVGARIRYGSNLAPRLRELIILVVAAHWHSRYEQYGHEATARSVGLNEEEIASLRGGAVPTTLSATERSSVYLARELLAGRDVADELYDDVSSTLGSSGLFALSTIVGYYSTLAMQLRLYRIEPPRH